MLEVQEQLHILEESHNKLLSVFKGGLAPFVQGTINVARTYVHVLADEAEITAEVKRSLPNRGEIEGCTDPKQLKTVVERLDTVRKQVSTTPSIPYTLPQHTNNACISISNIRVHTTNLL